MCDARIENWLSKLSAAVTSSLKEQLAVELSQTDAGSVVSDQNGPPFQANEENVHLDPPNSNGKIIYLRYNSLSKSVAS